MGKFKHGHANHLPGPRRRVHQLYSLWLAIKNRCLNERSPTYPSYGGRGIKVCEEWRYDPVGFIEWCRKNGWRKGLVIDRINNDGPYEPGNCRFTTYKVNSRNTRRNLILSAFGEEKTLAEWAEDKRACVSYHAIWKRITTYKWSAEEAIARPLNYRHTGSPRRNVTLTAFGETRFLADWAEDPRARASYFRIAARLRAGWEPEKAITQPGRMR